MTLGRRRKINMEVRAAELLESKLDTMHATREERELARGVYRSLVVCPNRPPLQTIVRRSIGAVIRQRQPSEGLPINAEQA